MNTKLNAEELAAKLFVKNISPMTLLGETVFSEQRRAAAFAIREIAQPIADQRDELLKAFEGLVARLELDGKHLPEARAMIARYIQNQ